MGILQSCFLHCIKRCGCCICNCCYGLNGKAFCTMCETASGKTVFNGAFDLILYDKWVKQTELYHHRVEIFKQLQRVVIPNKNVVEDQVILDVGCGTGAFTEVLCNAFMPNSGDKLLCLDSSPQCIHFVRTRVVDKLVPRIVSDTLSPVLQSHSENGRSMSMTFADHCAKSDDKPSSFVYFCNEPTDEPTDDATPPPNALCLDAGARGYDKNNPVSVVFMSLVLNHVSVHRDPPWNRHCLLKELFEVLKPGGAFVLFEFGCDFMRQFKSTAQSAQGGGGRRGGGGGAGDNVQLLTVADDQQHGFASSDELEKYIKGFGFTLETRVMEDTFKDDFWLFVFRKPAYAVI